MGEIGAMVARLEQEGLDLDRLIDDELEASGFLALCSRTTASLSDRADVISDNQNELKTLLKSIEEQLKKIQDEENIPASVLGAPVSSNDNNGVKHIIIIDDEEEVSKTDFCCQTNIETELPPVTMATSESVCCSTETASFRPNETSIVTKTAMEPAEPNLANHIRILPILTTSETTSKTIVSEEGVIGYRTLKSPTESGTAAVTSMVTLKSSQPTIPPLHLRTAATPAMPSASERTTIPDTRGSSGKQKNTQVDTPVLAQEEKRSPSPPKFEEGTRIIGKRADDLWYPGEIMKVLTDRYNQMKFRVKFDQGNKGLLRPNHIALESSPPVDVLNVGSRVVALRPRETADEAASWRQAKQGPYGKLDVLYAGIVAEICCPQNSKRFLIFFDDGFAQYLPLHKLHHVYHTGDKVWNEVAEHSQEFIQEYLEEFPNRPMVVLKTNQWVKTEWIGKWLKAKVMQVDCSLVKMLFQVDNRSEWIYRGSTRLEPLYRALIDGKISKSKKNKRQRKLPQNLDEPYVDTSLTSSQFGFSLYSKTDPKGDKQTESDRNRKESPAKQQQDSEGSAKSSKGQSLPKDSSALQNMASKQTTTTAAEKSKNTPTTDTHTSRTQALLSQSHTPPNIHTVGTNTSTNKKISHNTVTRKTTGTNTNTTSLGTSKTINNTPKSIKSSQGTQTFTSKRDTVPKENNSWSVPDSTVSIGWLNTSDNFFSPMNHIEDSTASIIQASTVRKRTTAGLVNKTKFNHVGTSLVGVGADSTTVLMNTPINGALSIMSPVNNTMKWEAPWKKRNIHCDGNMLKEPVIKPFVGNSKHDAAALIQERLQAEKKLQHVLNHVQDIKPLIPKPATLGPHKCGKQCGQTKQIDITEKSKHNMLALPLMLNWKREIAQRHPQSKKQIYYRAPCNKRLRSIEDVGKYLTLTTTCNVTIDQFCFDPEISCVDTLINTKKILLSDISHGAETVSISVANDYDKSYPPPIDYVSDRILSDGVNIVTDPGFLACCDCTDNCQDKTKCSCAQLTISASAAVDGKEDNTAGYEYRKLMDCVPTGIYECNQNCACSSQCFNRVVQNGIQLRLQVFKTENRGWGLRTLDDIPVGTFICTYSGQVMNEDMANKEGRDFGDEYLAELDHIEVVEKIKEGYESSVTDIEDDSVILKTLEGGSSVCSDNGFVSDSDMSSDSDSNISDSSSLYKPMIFGDPVTSKPKSREKDVRSQSITDDAVVFKEDGKMFRVSMADEKYVVASASDTGSIVLRRISVPSSDTPINQAQATTVTSPQEQVQDPPPMPCERTVIDLTSSDEGEVDSFPVENNHPNEKQEYGDKEVSKASSSLGDNFDLSLDISTESTLSSYAPHDDTQNNDNHVLSDSENINTVDNYNLSIDDDKKELSDNDCHDNLDIKIDSNSNKENDMDLIDSNSECKDVEIIIDNKESSSDVVLGNKPEDAVHPEDNTTKQSTDNISMDTGSQPQTDKDLEVNTDTNILPESDKNIDFNTKTEPQPKTDEETDLKESMVGISLEDSDLDLHSNSNHNNHKDIKNQKEQDDAFNIKSKDCDHVDTKVGGEQEAADTMSDLELHMDVDDETGSTSGHVTTNHDQQSVSSSSSSSSSDDKVPPLMSADDLSKLAANLPQPDEEPPKLTKMSCGLRLTDLKDTITKLQSRGVALDSDSPKSVHNKTPSFEDLPLFPESSSCDIDSFPPSPASTDSDSSVADSIEKSSEASFDRNVHDRNHGRRTRRFIVTLQKNGMKRSASPGVPGQLPIKKTTTRSLFAEEHCYVIDAKAYGNCGRYLNHSCSPNLFVQNIFIDTHDLRFPRVAFFAQHNISAGCELTWDYMYEVGSVQDKVLRCYCGSSQCRGRLL